jgi:uncharacterized membrane protein
MIVEQGAKPIEALRKSWQITKGARLKLFLFGIVLSLVNIAGFLALIVGIFVSIPVTLLAHAYVYRVLANQAISDKAANTKPNQPGPQTTPPVK